MALLVRVIWWRTSDQQMQSQISGMETHTGFQRIRGIHMNYVCVSSSLICACAECQRMNASLSTVWGVVTEACGEWRKQSSSIIRIDGVFSPFWVVLQLPTLPLGLSNICWLHVWKNTYILCSYIKTQARGVCTQNKMEVHMSTPQPKWKLSTRAFLIMYHLMDDHACW